MSTGEPTYGQQRQAVYKAAVAAAMFAAFGQEERAEECRRVAAEILARNPELLSELRAVAGDG